MVKYFCLACPGSDTPNYATGYDELYFRRAQLKGAGRQFRYYIHRIEQVVRWICGEAITIPTDFLFLWEDSACDEEIEGKLPR